MQLVSMALAIVAFAYAVVGHAGAGVLDVVALDALGVRERRPLEGVRGRRVGACVERRSELDPRANTTVFAVSRDAIDAVRHRREGPLDAAVHRRRRSRARRS